MKTIVEIVRIQFHHRFNSDYSERVLRANGYLESIRESSLTQLETRLKNSDGFPLGFRKSSKDDSTCWIREGWIEIRYAVFPARATWIEWIYRRLVRLSRMITGRARIEYREVVFLQYREHLVDPITVPDESAGLAGS